MKKLIGGAMAVLAVMVVVATARADDHLTPGTPGQPNCRGQTTAFLAQAQKNGEIVTALNAMGIGNIAKASDLTVKQVHDIVEQFCSQVPSTS
jgi:hypothetical protein